MVSPSRSETTGPTMFAGRAIAGNEAVVNVRTTKSRIEIARLAMLEVNINQQTHQPSTAVDLGLVLMPEKVCLVKNILLVGFRPR